ncbi:protein FAM81B [Erpetoichthys calabaricus]|uniref:protein FAM81B n=1 Tax=Erpetoichthys calabaricus TaxID=27687 RepID=UPI0010A031A9|nr:protein FAM81B [Erpetoichthys calabaricus]
MSRETSLQVYHQSPDKGQHFLPMISGSRVNVVEDRMSHQEKTIGTLLEQAFRIKEDIILNLRTQQGTFQVETTSRKLLENHIQTITNIVKQLSKDIETLEKQIIQRDNVSSGTSFFVQSLDQKHLAGIGDLRGRVARCDASISKLSGDISSATREVQNLGKEIKDVQLALEKHIRELELKMSQVLVKLEASLSEQNSNLKMAHGEQHHELNLLDVKINSVLEDLHQQIQNQKTWTEGQLSRTQQIQTQSCSQLHSQIKEKIENTEQRMQDHIHILTAKLSQAQERQDLEIKANRVKHAEDKLNARINSLEKKLWEELEFMRLEYKSGFQSIHDAIDSLHQINVTTAKLEKEKVQKDIKKIRRKITDLKLSND